MDFTARNVLITGGNSGIGLATARMFLGHGARVAITGRDKGKLAAAARELGSSVVAIEADFDEPGAIDATVAVVREAWGGLDILFANAGISGPTPLGSTTAAAFEAIFRTNVTGIFLTVQAALPLMAAGSAIVLNGSVMRGSGMPGTSAYSASKAAVSAMANVMAGELAGRGIRVNTVVPGGTRTPIWTRGARQGQTIDAAENRMAPAIPIGRFAEPEEVAAAACFYVPLPRPGSRRPKSSWMAG